MSFNSVVNKVIAVLNALGSASSSSLGRGGFSSGSGRDGLKVYQGDRTYGMPFYTVVNREKVYQGDRTYGTPAYTLKSDKIYQGDRTYGTPAFTMKF